MIHYLSTNARYRVSIVIPLYNENENLKALLLELEKISESLSELETDLEIVFVDNNSSDGTWNILKDEIQHGASYKAIGIKHVRNLGMQHSLVTGMNAATGDAIAVWQSDMQDPPSLLVQMVSLWRQGHTFIATKVESRDETFLNKISAWVFYRILSLISSKKVYKDFSDFYLFDRKIYDQIKYLFGSRPFVRTTLTEVCAPSKVIRYDRNKRENGSSKFNFSGKVRFALDAIVRDLGRLIQFLTIGAVSVGAISIIGIFVILIFYIFGIRSPVAGWATFAILGLFNLALSSLFFGLILEILVRVYRDLPLRSESVIAEQIESA